MDNQPGGRILYVPDASRDPRGTNKINEDCTDISARGDPDTDAHSWLYVVCRQFRPAWVATQKMHDGFASVASVAPH